MAMTAKKNRKAKGVVPEGYIQVYLNGDFYMDMLPSEYAAFRRVEQEKRSNYEITARAS